MKTLWLISLLLPLQSHSTTRAKEDPQRSTEFCGVRGHFRGAEVSRTIVRKRNQNFSADSVFWNLDIREVSKPSICPALGALKLRVRGADFRGTMQDPEITYAVDVYEPKQSAPVDLKIVFMKGHDSFTDKDYAEWTLQEQAGE